jgi:formylglycine-generating enzyme required for sulfatase activity
MLEVRHDPSTLVFALIPAGEDGTGSASAGRSRIPAFLLAKTQCTRRACERLMLATATPGRAPDLPRADIMAHEALALCRGPLRLPTETEWDHACRAGRSGHGEPEFDARPSR